MRGVSRGEEGDAGGVVGRDGGECWAEVRVAFKVAKELDLISSMGGGGGVVVCAQVDDFFPAVVAEGGVEEKGSVDALVCCCVYWGKICGSLEECGQGWGEGWW